MRSTTRARSPRASASSRAPTRGWRCCREQAVRFVDQRPVRTLFERIGVNEVAVDEHVGRKRGLPPQGAPTPLLPGGSGLVRSPLSGVNTADVVP